jgi:hypothetical protein
MYKVFKMTKYEKHVHTSQWLAISQRHNENAVPAYNYGPRHKNVMENGGAVKTY